MANLLLKSPSMMAAPKPSYLHSSSRFQRDTPPPPTLFSTRRPLSLPLSSKHAAAVSISPLLKEHNKGFGVNINCGDFWSDWDDVVQTDKKLLCRSNSSVPHPDNDIEATLRTLRETTRRLPDGKQSVTFHGDLEGLDAAKAQLLEEMVGEKLPRGVLLVGPPGTGKTLVARAVAGKADVAFISISASELAGGAYVWAARVRDVFWEARKRSPCIIFIDEIDAIGGGQLGMSFNSEQRDQILSQLLTEMEGTNVVVIAATNRPELLDPALMRPDRFSRIVVVGPGKPDDGGGSHGEGQTSPLMLQAPCSVGADLKNIPNDFVPNLIRL